MDLAQYCRDVEEYLCRKNGGHLVRLVGPSFDRVVAWAEQGVPLNVVFRGIDRSCERYYAKGLRRRPARVEYCEADVLDVFDEWRRAVGPSAGTRAPASGERGQRARRRSLAAHIDRLVIRLTTLIARPDTGTALIDTLEGLLNELEEIGLEARHARGDARARLLDRLEAMDQRLFDSARAVETPERVRELQQQAEAELTPFRDRMERSVFDEAVARAAHRLLTERLGLPQLRY